MTLGELFEETYIQGEIAIRSYDSTGTTIEHYLGDAEEFYPDEHPQILEREVGYIFPLMEVEPTICIELKNEEDEGMSGMKVKELMDSLKGDCYRFRVHYPEEWEFGLITGATFFGKRGLVLQHGEDDVSSFTLNPSWLSCEDETQRCIMVEIYLEP